MLIAIFESERLSVIEEDINNFMNNEPKKEIKHIKQSVVNVMDCASITISIFYETV